MVRLYPLPDDIFQICYTHSVLVVGAKDVQGKQLATVYSTAVMAMLPQTPLRNPPEPHESINDVTVLPSTRPQIFWPVPESQHFTRVEAGRAFDSKLLPAEARIPHPQLYNIQKSIAEGQSSFQANKEEWVKIQAKDVEGHTKIQNKTKKREARTTTIQTPRFQFKFEAVIVNKGGIGKYVDGIGQRYGVPPQDRKKGQIKIPTRVDG